MRERNNPIGWLSPKGEFYPCERTEHAEKAIELCGSQEAAFQSGWLACLNWEVACGFGMPAYENDITNEQREWLESNGYDWLFEVDDE